MLVFFPASWSKAVDAIALNKGDDEETVMKYFEKEKSLGVFSSRGQEENPEKIKVIEDLLVALAYIAENDSLPENLKKSIRSHFAAKTSAILGKCRGVLSHTE